MAPEGKTFSIHPDYQAFKVRWKLWNTLFDGNHDDLTGDDILWMHAIEKLTDAQKIGQTLRACRQERSRFLNLTEVITSLWQSLFFRDGYKPLPKATQELLGEDNAEKDIDGHKTSLGSFVRDQLLKEYFVTGRPMIMATAYPEAAASRAEEKEKGLRPFLEMIPPLSVPDWSLESKDPARNGRMNSFRQVYRHIEPRESVEQQIKQSTRCDIYVRREGSFEIRKYVQQTGADGKPVMKDGEPVWESPQGDSSLIQVPQPEITIAWLMSESWINNVAEENLRHFNIRSNSDNILYNQGYIKTYLAGKGLDDQEAQQLISEYSNILLPDGTTVTFSPQWKIADYKDAYAEAIDNAFKLGLNQHRSLPSDSRATMAADSMVEEKDNLYAIVESSVEQVETLVNDALRMYAAYKGRKDFEPGFELCDVKVDDVESWLKLYQATRNDLIKLSSFGKATAKYVIPKLNFAEDDTAKLLDEVETTDFTQDPAQQQKQQSRMDLIKAATGGKPDAAATPDSGRTKPLP
jgi:hypothetical protein